MATVRVESADRGRASYVGQNPSMTIRVDRNAEGDAIRMQTAVQQVAQEMQLGLPPGVTVELVRARAEQITDRLYLLLDNGLTGLGLVVMLLFLFLNARTAFWVAAGLAFFTILFGTRNLDAREQHHGGLPGGQRCGKGAAVVRQQGPDPDQQGDACQR